MIALLFTLSVLVNLLLYAVPVSALVAALMPRRSLTVRLSLLIVPLAFVAWHVWLYRTDLQPDLQRMERAAQSPIMKKIQTPEALRLVVAANDYHAGGNGECESRCRSLLLSGHVRRVVLEVIKRDGTISRRGFQKGMPNACALDTASVYSKVLFRLLKGDEFVNARAAGLFGRCVVDSPTHPLPAVSLYQNAVSPDLPRNYRAGGDHFQVLHLERHLDADRMEVLAHSEFYFLDVLQFPLIVELTSAGMEGSIRVDPHLRRKTRNFGGGGTASVLDAIGVNERIPPELKLPLPAVACTVLREVLRTGGSARKSAALSAFYLYWPEHHFLPLAKELVIDEDPEIASDARKYVDAISRFNERPCNRNPLDKAKPACAAEAESPRLGAEACGANSIQRARSHTRRNFPADR